VEVLADADLRAVIAVEGALASLQRLRRQPAQRNRTLDDQVHRFLGVRCGRKARYAWSLTRALEPERVPRPLRALVDHLLRIVDG
jgi:hypothetical protein